MPVPSPELITVGKMVSVFGIKGWVKVLSYTEPQEAILNFQPWRLRSADGTLALVKVDDSRAQGAGLVVHLNGVDDRDVARLYCQKDILADTSQLPVLEHGALYWHQLVGLKVLSTHANGECLLGSVKEMMETGANDVMMVAPCEGSVDKRVRLLPYLTGQYGIEVNLTAGLLKIDWDPEF